MAKAIKKFYKRLLFNLSKNNNYFYICFYKYCYKPEKGSISEFLYHYSKKKKDIYALQVGANDGFNHDPLHKFLKTNKWQAILIEPQKYVFEKFLNKLHKKADNIITLNAAMGETDGSQEVYKISFSNERWATGLASFYREPLQKKVDNGTITKLALKYGITPPESLDDYISVEKIDVISPQTLKKIYNIEHLDILMIDTEGYDFEIIKMILKVSLMPLVIIFEHTHFSEEYKKLCDLFLKSHNYDFVKISANTVAVQMDSDAFSLLSYLKN